MILKSKIIKNALFIVIVIFSVNGAFAQTPSFHLKTPSTLAVCSYSEFKPISYGDGQGYEADLLRAIAVSLQVKIKFYPQKNYEGLWLLPGQKGSVCDVAIGGLTPSDDRKEAGAVFSNAVMAPYSQSLLVRKSDYDSGRIQSYASFKGTQMKIGVVPGTAGQSYGLLLAQEYGLPASVFVSYDSESELLPALEDKKIDAIARGEIGNEYQEQLNPNVKTIPTRNFGEAFTIAVDPNNSQLLPTLNQAIANITVNGEVGYSEWQQNHQVFMQMLQNICTPAAFLSQGFNLGNYRQCQALMMQCPVWAPHYPHQQAFLDLGCADKVVASHAVCAQTLALANALNADPTKLLVSNVMPVKNFYVYFIADGAYTQYTLMPQSCLLRGDNMNYAPADVDPADIPK